MKLVGIQIAATLLLRATLSRSLSRSLSSSRCASSKSTMSSSANCSTDGGSSSFAVCGKCRGEGRVSRQASKRARLRHKRARMGAAAGETDPPTAPPLRWESCTQCRGTGLIRGSDPTPLDMMKVAIVGGGIGGLALGVALKHRGIPFTVYERDESFGQRRQGYGLTMQQASKALKYFGIPTLSQGITSTKHVVHTPDGEEIGSWGLRKWGKSSSKGSKRQNIHIARQSLRRELLDALGGDLHVQWGCQLEGYTEHADHVELTFQRRSDTFSTKADLLVGADGIHSTVRNIQIGEQTTPLRYLGCLVVLGICPRVDISSNSSLLDGETVFQTADGTTRLYVMPFSAAEYMWQLSYPLAEEDAQKVSRHGAQVLKEEALRLCGEWHEPIPELLNATPEALVSGYPVYDRALLTSSHLPSSRVTLLGDAAHPMSPFKGQGANQALLDALSLARALYASNNIKEALTTYKEEMLTRSVVKVKASAEAARFLHTDVAIQKGNVTRGAAAKNVQRNLSQDESPD